MRPDSAPVRTAGGPARYRRSMFRRSARASAGATARHTRVSSAAVRARGTGRLLPLRAGLVARTVPLRFLLRFDGRGGWASPGYFSRVFLTLERGPGGRVPVRITIFGPALLTAERNPQAKQSRIRHRSAWD